MTFGINMVRKWKSRKRIRSGWMMPILLPSRCGCPWIHRVPLCPTGCRPRARWITTIFPCRRLPAGSSPRSMGGVWCWRRRKKVFRAPKSPPVSGMSFRNCAVRQARETSISFLCICLTGWDASRVKHHLYWNGSSSTAFRCGAPTKVSSELKAMAIM